MTRRMKVEPARLGGQIRLTIDVPAKSLVAQARTVATLAELLHIDDIHVDAIGVGIALSDALTQDGISHAVFYRSRSDYVDVFADHAGDVELAA